MLRDLRKLVRLRFRGGEALAFFARFTTNKLYEFYQLCFAWFDAFSYQWVTIFDRIRRLVNIWKSWGSLLRHGIFLWTFIHTTHSTFRKCRQNFLKHGVNFYFSTVFLTHFSGSVCVIWRPKNLSWCLPAFRDVRSELRRLRSCSLKRVCMCQVQGWVASFLY